MDEKTLTALQGSIAKWEAIVAGTAIDEGEDNCPLCAMFLWTTNCRECPVAIAAKAGGCNGTPYVAWREHMHDKPIESYSWRADTDQERALAQSELDFLKSLVPSEQYGDKHE